jgi:hypothetical protein
MADRKYKWLTQVYTGADNQIKSDCNAIIFYNAGTTPCFVNSWPLVTGDRLILGGNENEIDTSLYTISFSAGGTNQLYVLRKYFV